MNILKSAILVGLCLLPVAGLTAGDNKPVIVLDASNSMWGQIGGHHKIELARDSLASLMKARPTATDNITLITYGGQHKGTCSDIKVFPTSDADTLLRQVATINPKGRSPISAAITRAAETGNQVLLISDGKESCDAAPCATATQLKTTYPQLQIHVVGFTDDPESQLHCIAENTGGKFTLASDTATLADLLTPSTVAENIPTISPDTPGKLELSLGAGDTPDNLPASFLLYDENDEYVYSFTARTEVSQTLPPGKYRVDALWKQMKFSEHLNIAPGETTQHRFNLGGMGKLMLDATDNQHKPANANFTIYTQDGDYLSDFLLKSAINEQLPAGNYRIRTERAGQLLETSVKIAPGEESRHTFVFDISSAE